MSCKTAQRKDNQINDNHEKLNIVKIKNDPKSKCSVHSIFKPIIVRGGIVLFVLLINPDEGSTKQSPLEIVNRTYADIH